MSWQWPGPQKRGRGRNKKTARAGEGSGGRKLHSAGRRDASKVELQCTCRVNPEKMCLACERWVRSHYAWSLREGPDRLDLFCFQDEFAL